MKECIVTVAPNMSDETYALLCEKAKRRFGEDLRFVRRTEKSVVGGFMLEIGNTVYDLTLKTQLDMLRTHLTQEETPV